MSARHGLNCSASDSELLQERVVTNFGDAGAQDGWMTEELCNVFAALRRKYGTTEERIALNQKYKNIICKRCKAAGKTCNTSTSIRYAMELNEQQYEQLSRWYCKAKKQKRLQRMTEVDVGFKSEDVGEHIAVRTNLISSRTVVDPMKYSAAKEVEDYNYKDQLVHRDTVGITNREDESVVTSSTLDVTDDSESYVIGEENVVRATMVDNVRTSYKDNFPSSDSIHRYNSSQLSDGGWNSVYMQNTDNWHEQYTVESGTPTHRGSYCEELNSFDVVCGDAYTAEYVCNIKRASEAFSYVNSSSLFNALGGIDRGAMDI
ncbi:uncharacterized protein C8R40DRAFT_1071074 [Lentinula edodes]|uniref:uncharacterized protein n=1 Tax=Lentinula edodes TaxID=5353 RepID=UPI001E8EC7EE|nr:uncharacterized protein C8R40DRAFT_1071074 [Lentinula edodes]KAH7873086.1 hypothetical protein C8R40DRAFT_1071074 [Lentinula edodes]